MTSCLGCGLLTCIACYEDLDMCEVVVINRECTCWTSAQSDAWCEHDLPSQKYAYSKDMVHLGCNSKLKDSPGRWSSGSHL
jgi:hypothetical protein